MKRRYLTIVVLVAAVAAGTVAVATDAPTDRIHRAVFDLPLADRYPLLTRRVDDHAAEYLFWSPDGPDATCGAVAVDPSMTSAAPPDAVCAFETVGTGEVAISVTVRPDPARGGSRVRVAAGPAR